MSRRDQIRMTDEELRDYLAAAKTMTICTLGPDGVPHPMPMWFGIEDDGAVVMTTFTKSQKIRNLERDPRVSLLVESGEEYAQLQGVVLYGEAELFGELDRVVDVLARVSSKGQPDLDPSNADFRKALEGTASKRTGIRVRPTRTVSWNHEKLGGSY